MRYAFATAPTVAASVTPRATDATAVREKARLRQRARAMVRIASATGSPVEASERRRLRLLDAGAQSSAYNVERVRRSEIGDFDHPAFMLDHLACAGCVAISPLE